MWEGFIHVRQMQASMNFSFPLWCDVTAVLVARTVSQGYECAVIYCSDGSGRSGTYVLLDMVVSRIHKGEWSVTSPRGQLVSSCWGHLCFFALANHTYYLWGLNNYSQSQFL